MISKKGLGRGLDALITERESELDERVFEVDINRIEPNREQPRRDFDETELRELAASVRIFGVLSPLLVRRDGEFYSIVAGERRWRAARMAGLKALPVVVKEFDERETLEVALIENLQRSDLNPLEEALSYRRLLEEFGLTQEKIAERIGKSRSSVANALRLLKLPETAREMLRKGSISTGHAKAMLGLESDKEMAELAERTVAKGLNVREVEDAVKAMREGGRVGADSGVKIKAPPPPPPGNEYFSQERELERVLGTRTRIRADRDGASGRIEIEFVSRDDLDRLFLTLKSL